MFYFFEYGLIFIFILLRYGHSAQIIGSRMFIFGGKGDNGKILNDVYFLDLIEWIWVPVACITTGPTPRLIFINIIVHCLIMFF